MRVVNTFIIFVDLISFLYCFSFFVVLFGKEWSYINPSLIVILGKKKEKTVLTF